MNPPADADHPRARVRVTGPDGPPPPTAAVPLQGESDVSAVYARGLVRAQLLLALGCLLGFVVCAGGLALALAVVPSLDAIVLWGVPLSWLLHAFGFYPIILVFALIYAHSAARNERRFRALSDGAR